MQFVIIASCHIFIGSSYKHNKLPAYVIISEVNKAS
jgi:hypothetical protein